MSIKKKYLVVACWFLMGTIGAGAQTTADRYSADAPVSSTGRTVHVSDGVWTLAFLGTVVYALCLRKRLYSKTKCGDTEG